MKGNAKGLRPKSGNVSHMEIMCSPAAPLGAARARERQKSSQHVNNADGPRNPPRAPICHAASELLGDQYAYYLRKERSWQRGGAGGGGGGEGMLYLI